MSFGVIHGLGRAAMRVVAGAPAVAMPKAAHAARAMGRQIRVSPLLLPHAAPPRAADLPKMARSFRSSAVCRYVDDGGPHFSNKRDSTNDGDWIVGMAALAALSIGVVVKSCSEDKAEDKDAVQVSLPGIDSAD